MALDPVVVVRVLPSESKGTENFARSSFSQERIAVIDDLRNDGAGKLQSGWVVNHPGNCITRVRHDFLDVFVQS